MRLLFPVKRLLLPVQIQFTLAKVSQSSSFLTKILSLNIAFTAYAKEIVTDKEMPSGITERTKVILIKNIYNEHIYLI